MKLIIAEKPSLGRNIASAIGDMKNRNGYLEGKEYIVTWAFGHLFSLADIESYSDPSSRPERWTLDNLPCFPEDFRFGLRKDQNKKEDSGVKRQFELIKSLCLRDDVDTLINAGDADREGEIIIRICMEKSGVKNKDLMRLWLPDQTPQTIRKALAELKSENEYDNIACEGYARMYMDWLYGTNLTRYATLKSGTLLRVGRVIVPIVKAIYDRDMAIRNFVAEKYYAIVSDAKTNGETVQLTSKEKFSKEEYEKAISLCQKYNDAKAVVSSVKRKKESIFPGKLYSLSKLQNVLGKKYKMSMAESLEIVQKLYEAGYLTYPRTNSEYLATAEKDKIKQIISNCKEIGYPVSFKDKKSIFDDKKIESHSALTPTYKIPDRSKLSEKEMQVYSTVFRRFIAVFCDKECIAEKTEIIIDLIGDDYSILEQFTLKGTVIVEPGWTKYDDYNAKDKILPLLNKGDIINTNFKPVEKETTPPRHYTIETLNNYLKNPFKDEKAITDQENDDEEYKAIFEGLELGTEATRTGIIDNARKSHYIELKKDVYHILPGGEYLIESLMHMNISMDKFKTAEMGKALKKVYRGEISIDESLIIVKEEISQVFKNKDCIGAPETDTESGFYGDEIGKCPLCGETVIRGRYGYECSKRKDGCEFRLNSPICGRVVSVQNAKLLLETGRTSKIQGFISRRTGKSFDSYLKLENGKIVFDFGN
ncbi:MAG: DNA topoisomerase III [Ruminococcaceae bacterium]|nr:DNA topoisomerase III [Oscillospiraceae bacterium]